MTLANAFKQFSDKGDGKEMTSKAMTRWFTDAGVLSKTCTSQNLDIAFSAAKPKGKQTMTMAEMDDLINRVADSFAKDNKCTKDEAIPKIKDKLAAASKVGHGTTGVSKTGNVDHFTDTTQYTGAHKERFDESGKGKGIDGRADRSENSGYTGQYKGAGTYDGSHK